MESPCGRDQLQLLGAYMADQYWGCYKTIQISIFIAIVGHILLIIATLPSVIASPNGSIACFSIGLIIFGIGTGGFKPNISPLIAEQYEAKHPRQYIQVKKSGERVIVDPTKQQHLVVRAIGRRIFRLLSAVMIIERTSTTLTNRGGGSSESTRNIVYQGTGVGRDTNQEIGANFGLNTGQP